MNRKTAVSGAVATTVIIVILVTFYTQSNDSSENQDYQEQDLVGPNTFQPLSNNWQSSGPFKINRDKYLLGENLFIVGESLEPTDKGQIAILHPKNKTHYKVYTTIPFDGSEKLSFNYHFTPQISEIKGICDMSQLVGTWKVVFQGTQYENLEFQMMDDILPGDEWKFEPQC